jgi:hypothetical protein
VKRDIRRQCLTQHFVGDVTLDEFFFQRLVPTAFTVQPFQLGLTPGRARGGCPRQKDFDSFLANFVSQ